MVEQAGMSDDAVKAATGKDWATWRQWIDGKGGAALSHAEIARLLHANGVPGWWSQMVTVGYERLTGRRAMGQRCDGAFSASASRTLNGDMDQALAKWLLAVDGMTGFNDAFAEDEPRQSRSEKWRYWRIDLDDGSKVSVTICDKAGGKAIVAVGHEKLGDAAAVHKAKAFWKTILATM
jgi:hypothetical protein